MSSAINTINATEIINDTTLGAQAQGILSRHCLATVIVKDYVKLTDSRAFSDMLKSVLAAENVQCLGELTHDFANDSFTSVFCLAESHISVHTWPERYAVQLDVFLCNYINDNTEKCERLFNSIVEYFGDAEIERTIVERL